MSDNNGVIPTIKTISPESLAKARSSMAESGLIIGAWVDREIKRKKYLRELPKD